MNKKYRKKAYCPDTIGKNLVAQKVSLYAEGNKLMTHYIRKKVL